MAAGLHISIVAEDLFAIGGFPINNSVLTSLVISATLIIFAIITRLKLTNTSHPTGWQNFAEWIVETLMNLVDGITNNKKKTQQFFPWIATFLLFILLNNWLGLLPGVGTIGITHTEDGESHVSLQPSSVELNTPVVYASENTHQLEEVAADPHQEEAASAEQSQSRSTFVPLLRPGTADLNTTLALALISVILTQVFGVLHLGLGYFKKFINFSDPIMFFVGILEVVSEFAKIISFAFRLFGNVFAGEVLLVVISFLIPLLAPVPFYGLEVFVGFIQALVFAMLSLVFFNMATQSHDEH